MNITKSARTLAVSAALACVLGGVGVALVPGTASASTSGAVVAKHGADDPVGHERHGADDPVGHHVVVAKHGADDPIGHKKHGADDPVRHA